MDPARTGFPGSIGCSATPGRVQKGKKLPGRMGYQRVTIKNLKVVDVRPEMDVVLVQGAVPGSPTALLKSVKFDAVFIEFVVFIGPDSLIRLTQQTQ